MVDQKSVNLGKEILMAYHQASQQFPNYTFTFGELLDFYGNKTPFMLEGLGDNVLFIKIVSLGEAKETMRDFAAISSGEIPLNWQSYHFAITRMASNPSFWKALQFTTTETAKTIAVGVQEHGGQVISTLRAYNKFLPWLVLGAGVLLVTGVTGNINKMMKKRIRK